ncbi:EAL domain-containing protein [Lysinibacillus sp. SGAir0095]|uniref:sensor domain-containing protein n=1 Tax=Lysinibacillus sp. SGAir0095 TaxID=2070463 RepID=UPI0010CCBAD6|nr:EAL domain-containing protein [Lysinibacillus sp. SGAir0095]QCR30868.1 diguanylate cyclase [Lysinibacillus sp. SGAir0095]
MRYKEPKLNILKRLFNNEENSVVTEQNKDNSELNSHPVEIEETMLINEINSFQYIFDNLTSGIWMREEIHGDLLYASKGFEAILNLPLKVIYETPSLRNKMVHPLHKKEVATNFELLAQGKTVQMLYPITDGKGQKKWLLEQIVPRVNKEGVVTQIFGMITDVTHEMDNEEKLNFLANYDSLTRLPNQKSLFEKLDQDCRERKTFALFYLDIDRFYVINNSLGYQIGDEALKKIALRLTELTPEDGYLARLNSNDFIIIFKNYRDEKEVYQLAEKILRSFEEAFTVQDYVLHITTSIGITFFPEEGERRLTLLENAHTALYQAKRQGKNTYQLFSHSRDIPSYKKYVLDRDMRLALLNGEFTLYFQPQVEPSKGFIVGAEVLLRWQHPEWGDISPAEFIPLAEENHMVNQIIDWEIEKVCTILHDWKKKGYRLYPVSINISPIRFMKKGLVEFIQAQLEKYEVNPHYLELEITESSLIKTDQTVLTILKELKALGVKVAIDDFGTGYSSLDYLRKIKPDTIKIDKTFINNIKSESEIDKGVIASILFLGKRLDMKVVAEGVEEKDQLEFLKQNECDMIQGFLFSEPVPQEKYEKLIQVGYLKAVQRTKKKTGMRENRKYYRFELPFHIHGKMTIAEVNDQVVQVGSTPVLIENFSLAGIKILSNLKLPVNSNMKFKFEFKVLGEVIEVYGKLRWIEDELQDVYSYGVIFNLNRTLEDNLARLINRMTTLRIKNQAIPNTEFVYDQVTKFFSKE